MLCTFYYDVVTAVCQLLINEYVMLCHVCPQACAKVHSMLSLCNAESVGGLTAVCVFTVLVST